MTLTKAELADLLFEQLGLNKREAKDMVERFFEEIRAALEEGRSVKLSGFGNFQLRETSPPSVEAIDVFDVYRGDELPNGTKSVAILVLMRDT